MPMKVMANQFLFSCLQFLIYQFIKTTALFQRVIVKMAFFYVKIRWKIEKLYIICFHYFHHQLNIIR